MCICAHCSSSTRTSLGQHSHAPQILMTSCLAALWIPCVVLASMSVRLPRLGRQARRRLAARWPVHKACATMGWKAAGIAWLATTRQRMSQLAHATHPARVKPHRTAVAKPAMCCYFSAQVRGPSAAGCELELNDSLCLQLACRAVGVTGWLMRNLCVMCHLPGLSSESAFSRPVRGCAHASPQHPCLSAHALTPWLAGALRAWPDR